MQATFEVQEIIQPWKPPFEKKISNKEYTVQANEGFDLAPKITGAVFKLIQLNGDRALVEYHRDFTPKGYEQPQARQFWFKIGESREFSHLWGENGTTKKLTFKGMQTSGVPTASEPLTMQEQIENERPNELPPQQSRIIEA
jgi:hypothetical protein